MKVLIVGAGPVGLTCSHLLSRLGIENTIIERQSHFSTHPSAHFLHSRTMEIFDTIHIADPIYASMPNPEQWRRFIYCSSLQGTHYRSHDHFQSSSFKLNSSLTHFLPAHFPQNQLVSLLASKLPSQSTLLMGEELKDFSGTKKIKVKTTNKELEADYLIACDGSASLIREKLGIPLSSKEVLQSFLNIHFISKDLGNICKRFPAMIYFVYNNDVVVVLVMHSSDNGEFVLQVPDFPPFTKPSDYTLETVKDIIKHVAGEGEDVNDILIKSIKPWRMTSRNAKTLRAGNIFLAGDAAHSLTPAGGFGLNTGVSDVHNLAWKFKFPELLDSYEKERLGRIQEILVHSYKNYEKVVKIAQNFGLDITMVKPLVSVLESMPFGSSIFKLGMAFGQQYLLNDINAKSFLANDSNLLDLMFPNVDLMFKYKNGFFEKGGELGSNHEVEFEGRKTVLRMLPGYLARDEGKCLFVRVVGEGKVADIEYPSVDVQFPGHESMILRPDGHVYWRHS